MHHANESKGHKGISQITTKVSKTVQVTDNEAIPLVIFYLFIITENKTFYSISFGK